MNTSNSTDPTGGRRVAFTVLPSGVEVSTVQMPVLPEHLRLLLGYEFETMVFPDRRDCSGLDCTRYTTREEAEAGHARTVAKWALKVRSRTCRGCQGLLPEDLPWGSWLCAGCARAKGGDE